MTVPSIPPATPEARMAYPQTPVQEFTSEPLPDLQGVFDAAGAAGAGAENDIYAAGPRQAEARDVMQSAAGYGDFDILGGFSGQGETTHGWPNDVRPPPYETPLHPGPHGG